MLNLDDPRFRLHDVLTKYEALTASRKAAPPVDGRQQSTGAAFDRLIRDVIRPVMEEIGAELEGRGHQYEILIEPGQQITMRLYPPLFPRSAYTTACCPYVAFSRDVSTTAIHVVQSTLMPNGQGSAVIACTLSPFQLTRRDVAALILDVLEKVRCAHTTDPDRDEAAK
jgi:hypothetical protein